MDRRVGIIYGIFIEDQCIYIGKVFGQRNILKRKREHLHHLRHNKHHSIKLQELYNQGFEFNYKIIGFFDDITDNELYLKEEEYIKKYNTYHNGCNTTSGGKGVKGVDKTEEIIKKISDTKLKGFEEGRYIKTWRNKWYAHIN